MRFAKYGLPELKLYGGITLVLALAMLVLSLMFISKISLALLITFPFAVLFAFVLSFFRDPKRAIPKGEHRFVSPADGTVYDIGEVDEPEFLGEPALRIGIFLSIFDCHINRAPCSGTVEKIIYKQGRFISALNAKECSEKNESNFVGISNAAGQGFKVGVKQIAGQIARRIVCELKEGEPVGRGDQFGMIKFGSRTEFFIPKSVKFETKVKLGGAVLAGQTVLGVIEIPAPPKSAESADDAAELEEVAESDPDHAAAPAETAAPAEPAEHAADQPAPAETAASAEPAEHPAEPDLSNSSDLSDTSDPSDPSDPSDEDKAELEEMPPSPQSENADPAAEKAAP